MNLHLRHAPWLIIAAGTGAAIGYGLSFLFPNVRLWVLTFDGDQRMTWAAAGGIISFGLTTFAFLVTSAWNPNGELPTSITSSFLGSILVGRRDLKPDGSYVSTEWLALGGFPIIPLCSYRLFPKGPNAIGAQVYDNLGKVPISKQDLVRGYSQCATMIVVAIAILGMCWWYVVR